jgi:hypothetical protein
LRLALSLALFVIATLPFRSQLIPFSLRRAGKGPASGCFLCIR